MTINSQDKALRDLLRSNEWIAPAPSAGFRSGVWARIEARRRVPATWREWVKLHLVGFATAAVVSVVFSSGAGGWIATLQISREREAMVARYVASIDPHSQVTRPQINLVR